MGGILLPGVVIGWVMLSLWASHHLGRWLTRSSKPGEWTQGLRLEAQALALVVILPLPLIDELLAKPQFDALCRDQAALHITAGPAAQRLVQASELPPESVEGLLVPVSRRKHVYIDQETHQALASFSTFQAHAGKLARLVGTDDVPLTFSGVCGPADLQAQLAQAGWRERIPQEPGVGASSH